MVSIQSVKNYYLRIMVKINMLRKKRNLKIYYVYENGELLKNPGSSLTVSFR